MDNDGKIKVNRETLQNLMKIAKDLSDLTGAYVSVSEIANQLLMEKMRAMFDGVKQEETSVHLPVAKEPMKKASSIGDVEIESIYTEASRLSQELKEFQQYTPSVGPTQGSIQEQVFTPPHAAHAQTEGGDFVDPSKDSSAHGHPAESKQSWPKSYMEKGNPPGFYPGFPSGLIEIAANDPFIQPAPNAEYRPIYTIQSSDNGNRYISFSGWQPNVVKDNGNVYMTDSEGKKKLVAYKSNRLFPERTGKKLTIPGTKATVSDGSDGDTAIILGQD